jgi:DNA polymerase-3 subunit epsilon
MVLNDRGCGYGFMTPGEINLADLAATLERSPDDRVLRRLIPRTEFAASNGQPTKIGILLSTTGT